VGLLCLDRGTHTDAAESGGGAYDLAGGAARTRSERSSVAAGSTARPMLPADPLPMPSVRAHCVRRRLDVFARIELQCPSLYKTPFLLSSHTLPPREPGAHHRAAYQVIYTHKIHQ
jgi:hypothetical protein